jgi:RIO-like serine/threonine protein kinase
MSIQLIDSSNVAADGPSGTPADRITRGELETARQERLREGRWANVVLYRLEHRGAVWVVKDFRSRSFLARNLIGRFLMAREMRGLSMVAGVEAPPRAAIRVDGFALAYRFLPGRNLRKLHGAELRADFFPALERIVQHMHASARIVHLDLRNADNILVTEHGAPALLDFQSHVSTRWMPGPLRRFAQDVDLAAIYKHWAKRRPETLGAARAAALARMNRLRPLWVLSAWVGTRRSGTSAAR